MARHDKPPAYALSNGQHPSSPPMTPGTRSQSRFPPQTSHTSPTYKRMGFAMLAQTPPLEFIVPTGQGHQFHFTRPQSREPASRPSTASGLACATTPQESEDETESDEESAKQVEQPARRVDYAEFVLEELDSDPGYDSDIEVVRPDHYEDARSDKSENNLGDDVIEKMNELHCRPDSSDEDEDEEERLRIYRRKKKRWSAGTFIKRTYDQSIEGDSSYSDNDPLDDVDASARRLRRRVRGPGDRLSLNFEDKGFSNANHIVEVEEPDDGEIPHVQGPPSIPSDDAFTLDELPFWGGEDPMEVESDSDSF